MSIDLEQHLRDGAAAIPEPADAARKGAERALLGKNGSSAPRRRRLRVARPRLAAAAAGFALAAIGLVSGVGIGFAVVPRDAQVPDAGPGFLPAAGWTTVSTGSIPATEGPTAIATNGELIAEPGPIGTFPVHTIGQLIPSGILVFATLGTRGENAGVDALFPRARLPFRASEASVDRRWEGQPREDVPQWRLRGAVGSWNVDVRIYFGTPTPASDLVEQAQEALERLVLPTA